MSLESELLSYWQYQDEVTLRPPVSAVMQSDFEQKFGVRLPLDIQSYLLQTDGFEQTCGSQDENGFNFWPLENFEPVNQYAEGQFAFEDSKSYFIFADYLDFCWGYAIRLDSNEDLAGKVVMVGTESGKPLTITDSFSKFVELYIKDSPNLYPSGK